MEELAEQESEEPVVGWFTVTAVPIGDAPEAIKSDWVGVTIPVRVVEGLGEDEIVVIHGISDYDAEIRFRAESTVTVNTTDAIIALRLAGHDTAAEWWLSWLTQRMSEYGSGALLTFQKDEGEVRMPDEIDASQSELSGHYSDSDLVSYIKRVRGED